MGLFSAKKKTYVSSVVYPLGEDGADRTDMLKYTILNANLQDKNVAESIQESFLRGQGMSLRRAFSYARDTYVNGLPVSAARYADQPDLAALGPVLQAVEHGAEISLITTLVGTGDFAWWAERYLADNYGYSRVTGKFSAPPKGVETGANVAYDLEPDGSIRILLMNDNGAVTTLSYRPTDYVRMASYVHCAYRTRQVFEDGVTTSTRPANEGETSRTTYATSAVDRNGETQTTTTETRVVVSGSTATVTVSKSTEVLSRPKYFLYRIGTNIHPSLDALLTTEALTAPYFPSIPLRVDNKSWTDAAHESTPLYKTSAKLLKKVGLDLADLGERVETNENIKEIDYCFVTFGVRLNTDSPEGKRYIFRFLSYLRSISQTTSTQYNAWVDAFTAAFPGGPDGASLPAGGVQAPPTNSLEIYSAKDRQNNHDVKLQWQYIDTRLVTGTVKEGARPGDVEILAGSQSQFSLLSDMILDGSVMLARRQVDENTYEELVVSGLVYENFVYKGHSVIVTAHDALTQEDEDGFLLPLNQEIIRATPMVEMTNLSYQCMYMVFNCYKVVKQKWYQTTLFKIIIVIIAIIIVVVSWGSAAPAAGTMLAAVFGGMVALGGLMLVLAATLYVLAMMVLMSILMRVATKAFGPTWGPIIATIIAIVGMNYASTGTLAGGAASASTISAQNIIQASSALANIYLQHQMAGINKELSTLASDYKTGMAKIEDLTKEYLSTSLDLIDIQGYTESTQPIPFELPGDFLTRTLLTGPDICMITHGLVTNFAEVGLQLPSHG